MHLEILSSSGYIWEKATLEGHQQKVSMASPGGMHSGKVLQAEDGPWVTDLAKASKNTERRSYWGGQQFWNQSLGTWQRGIRTGLKQTQITTIGEKE